MRKFTKFIAALALLLFMTPTMVGWGQTMYEQLTSIANIDENAQYVLGIDGVGFHYSNTSGWGLTGLPADHTPFYYRLVVADDGQSFKAYVDTPIYGNTYYMTIPTSNAFLMSTNQNADNTDLIIGTSYVSETNYAVANKNTTARHLRRNGTSGLRSYAGSTGSMVYFYKVVTSGTSYSVTYHANVTGTSDIEVVYGEGDDVTVADNTFTNPGYAFTEWNTEADGTGDSYSPGDVIEGIDDDIDLYAQWEVSTSTTGMIRFGSSTGHVKINAAFVTGDDDINNEWTITTVGTTSFTQASTYSQVGSSNSPATSITFTTTLPEEVEITSMEVKFGGFAGTAGTITMKVGGQTIGTGSLNATNDMVVNSSSTATGDVLTVTVTNISKGVKCYYISYTFEEATPDPAVATTTTINVPSGFNTDIHNGTSAGTLTATVTAEGNAISGATVTWESSNTSVATIAANGAVTLVAVGTTTITASYAGVEDQYRPSSDTYELTVTDSYAPGTVNNPYTVAQARAAIDANTGITGVYVTGIISQVDSYSNNTITYWISDDGTTTNQLEVYKGKNLNNTNFTALSDVEVGATVIVFGTLTKYNNTTYEFTSGNYLTSYTAPQHAVEAPTFSPAAGTYTEAQTVTISCGTSGATIYYTTDGTEPTNASTEYTTALTISTTTTIKAVAYDGTNYSNVTTATYHFCSAEDPYTVTEALAFSEYPANNIYVSGIVSTAPTSLSSGTLTYFISVDGEATNELEVYKGKGLENANFTAVGDIQVGDIVTVYGNVVIYGTTNPIKEFAQGNYLVSFERPTTPAQEYTLTIGNPANVTITAGYGTEGVLNNGDYGNILSGTEITLVAVPADGYTFEGFVVTDANGNAVTLTESSTTPGVWSFYMPNSNVTVSASVVVAPATSTYTLATSIESGKQYIIVGQANGNYYAMGNDKGNNRYAYGITLNGTTATADIANTGVHEFTITSLGEGYYSIMDATTNGGYLYAASSGNNYLKTETTLDENHNGDWKITITDGSFSVVADQSSNRNVMQFNNGSILFACYASASQHAVYLYVKDETPTPAPITLDINAWTTDQNGVPGNWYLITSPLHDTINPVNVGNMIPENLSNVDLYRFDQNPANGLEWINYKNQDGSGVNTNFGDLMPGTGYLYANAETIQLQFTGTPYSGDGVIPLSYSTENQDATMHGWNLVGNPFTVGATIDRDFYWMNPDGRKDIIVAVDENNPNPTIAPMEGIFVQATGANQSVTFTPSETKVTRVVERTVIELTQNNNVIDRAIIRYGSGSPMPKIQLNENNTKIYFMMENGSYAVVVGDYQAELPLNFKAATAGSYTLSFNNQNAEFSYLHLIDNQTNTETDLLVNPNYTFSAQTTDNAARFIVVYERAYFGKGITGYGEGDGHYYLLASPIGEVDPDRVGDMFKFEHDLYYFDQDQELEWINIKDGNTNLMPCKGYLYASKQDVTLKFYGSAYNGEGDVTLVKNATNNPEGGFEGWNLVGNPFAQTAYLDRDFYVMRDDGAEIILSERDSIGAMEGIFVNAVNDGESMTFSTSRVQDKGQVVLNVTKGRGITVDRALVRFGEGRQMPKIQLFKNSTKVYIPVDGQDYAVVRGEEMGEMPVSFKAESNDTYTLNLSKDNVEFAYLHLIDNMTGADIDLLQNPSYSFEAKATDYSQRFKLVFATGNSSSDTFAFFSNGSFVINNEGNATLQVIDVTGRIIKCESINGCANVNVNAASGVYMLRLVNGDNVKVQKVVVK